MFKVLKNIQLITVLLAFAMLPFNDLPYFHHYFREMAYEGSFYPMVFGVIVTFFILFNKQNKPLPRELLLLTGLLFLWIFLSGLVNTPEILNASFKEKTGLIRYLSQMIVFVFMVGALLATFNVRNEQSLKYFKVALWSSAVVSILYFFLEYLYVLKVEISYDVLTAIAEDVKTRGNYTLFTTNRFSSVSGEPSWFGIYFVFVWPLLVWFLSSIRLKFIVLFLTIFILLSVGLYLGHSLSAFLTIGIQLIVLVIIIVNFYFSNRLKLTFFIGMTSILLIVGIIFYTPFENYMIFMFKHSGSFNVRFGMQATSLNMGLDNPFFGVGLGQFGFHFHEYLAEFVWKNNGEISAYLDPLNFSAWPATKGLNSRIVGELGFIGFAIWMSLWIHTFIRIYQVFKQKSVSKEKIDIEGLMLLVMVCGVFMAGFTFGSFRYFEWCFALGLAWSYLAENTIKMKTNE